MRLVIDIGNTNIVLGLYSGNELKDTLRVHTVAKKTEDEYGILFSALLAERKLSMTDIESCLISSVVPGVTMAISAMIERLTGRAPWLLGQKTFRHLPLGIVNPQEIGTDLVANCLAAWERERRAAIVVDFGTALTFTAMDGEGVLQGVAIVPGLNTAVAALSRDTAQLPFVPLAAPSSALGKNTVQAIQSGIVYGYAGLVTTMIGRFKAELGCEAKVYATGGLCGIVAPLVGGFDVIDMNLTLDGLAAAARYLETAAPGEQAMNI